MNTFERLTFQILIEAAEGHYRVQTALATLSFSVSQTDTTRSDSGQHKLFSLWSTQIENY